MPVNQAILSQQDCSRLATVASLRLFLHFPTRLSEETVRAVIAVPLCKMAELTNATPISKPLAPTTRRPRERLPGPGTARLPPCLLQGNRAEHRRLAAARPILRLSNSAYPMPAALLQRLYAGYSSRMTRRAPAPHIWLAHPGKPGNLPLLP